MAKQLVKWKAVTLQNRAGEFFDAEIAKSIEYYYRGTLISKILEMPKKTPVSFLNAVRVAGQEYFQSDKVGDARFETEWLLSHFVEWISELGFHIELTGDEFEHPASKKSTHD